MFHKTRISSKIGAVALVLALAIGASACGSSSKSGSSKTGTSSGGTVALRLGYFPNVTHATAIIGVAKGFYTQALGANVKFSTKTFNAGPEATEALLSGAIDASYLGPNPAINAFQKSKAIKIISGATSGGALLVVKPNINSAADLKGKKVADPQLGGTQDVALRAWLKSQGLSTTTSGGGDVSIQPHQNADTLQLFQQGAIAGAWLPEPWATRLVVQGGGKILVNEASLWPQGQFVTTHLIVATSFLDKHPDVVQHLLEGQVKANDYLNANPDQAKKEVNAAIAKLTGKALPAAVIDQSWTHLTFTNDPIASSLQKNAEAAKAAGLLKSTDITGIYDLGPLNAVLKSQGKAEVSGP